MAFGYADVTVGEGQEMQVPLAIHMVVDLENRSAGPERLSQLVAYMVW